MDRILIKNKVSDLFNPLWAQVLGYCHGAHGYQTKFLSKKAESIIHLKPSKSPKTQP